MRQINLYLYLWSIIIVIGLALMTICYPRLAWLALVGMAILVLVRNWFYWRWKIRQMTANELFFAYVYHRSFPLFMLRQREFSQAEQLIVATMRDRLSWGIATEDRDEGDYTYFWRADHFVKMAKEVKLKPSHGLNPFLWLAGGCLILAAVMPIIAIKYGGWETAGESWNAAVSSAILFGLGAFGFGWVAWKIEYDDELGQLKNKSAD